LVLDRLSAIEWITQYSPEGGFFGGSAYIHRPLLGSRVFSESLGMMVQVMEVRYLYVLI
jgi:hypothetical protein